MKNATRRFLSVLLTLVMVLTAAPLTMLSPNALIADAADGRFVLSAEKEEDKLIVILSAENISNLNFCNLKIYYDSAVVDCTAAENSEDIFYDAATGNLMTAFNVEPEGEVAMGFSHKDCFSESTFDMFKLTFDILDSNALSTEMTLGGDSNIIPEVSGTFELSLTGDTAVAECGDAYLTSEIDGDMVTVRVWSAGIQNFTAGNLDLEYDESVLKYKSKAYPDFMSEGFDKEASIVFNTSEAGMIRTGFYHEEYFSSEAFEIFSITFSIENTEAASSTVSLTGTVSSGSDSMTVVRSLDAIADASVKVCTHEDNNGDFLCDLCSEEMPYSESGNFGESEGNNVTWKLYDDGTLRFSGTGKTYDADSWNRPWDDDKVTKIVFDNGITYIGSNICYTGEKLSSVIIPASVNAVNPFAFNDCKKLKAITLTGNNPALTVDGLIVFNKDKTSLIRCFDASLKEYTVPSSVKSIENSAFYNCTALEKIIIPETVTKLGNSVFYGCIALKTVNISKNVTELAYSVFENCTSLQSIALPEKLESIGRDVFNTCESLTAVTLPDTVKEMGPRVFAYCHKLESVKLSKGLTVIKSRTFDNCVNLKSIVIPEGVKEIEYSAFYNCLTLTSVTLPDTLTYIDDWCFAKCSALKSVSLPDSVTELGNSVFSRCTALETVKLSAKLKEIPDSMFWDCTSLKNITIPDGVTNIKSCAFYNCSSLAKIVIPATVKSIDNSAFRECTALAEITVPDSVESIGPFAFERTAYESNASNWKDGALYVGNHLIGAKDVKGAYTVRQGTKTVGGFIENKEITSITIPDSVTSLQYSAFNGCSKLNKVELPDKLVKIPGNAFYGTAFVENEENYENMILYTGTYLIKAKAPDSVWNDEKEEWEDVPGISGDVVIKEGIKYIIQDAFAWCGDITSVKLPSTLEYIADHAFYYCIGLEEIVLPEKVSLVEANAFISCYNLKKITVLNPFAKLSDGFVRLYEDSDDFKFTICGYDNSTAQAYAQKHKIDFVSLGAYDIKEVVKETEEVKTVGDSSIFAVEDNTVEALINSISNDVVIKDKDGKDVAATDTLKSGMTVTFTDAEGKAVKTLTVVVPGDNDGDGAVSSSDARSALRAAVGLDKLNDWQMSASDVEDLEQKKISSADARYILRAAVGLESVKDWMKNI